MRKAISVLMLLCAAAFLFSGCSTVVEPDSPDSGTYSTQMPMTALEYQIFMAKEITVYVNQLTTHISMMANSDTGMYENELELAQESLTIMQDVYDEVTVTMPAETADDDRDAVLTAMSTAIGHMEDYISALEEGGDISRYSTDFKNDNNALTGLSNLYYQ